MLNIRTARPSVRFAPSPGAAGVALALVSALASGTLGIWGKLALTANLGTPTLLSWRFGLLALLLLACGFWRVQARERRALLLLGLLYAFTAVTYFMSLARITAGTAALLVYVAPAFVILYGALAGTRPANAQLGALLCTLAGLGVVVGLPGAGDGDVTGLLLGALSGGLYGAFLYASHRLARKASALAVTAHVSLVSAVVFVVLGAVVGDLTVPVSATHWGIIVGTLLLPTLVALPALTGAVRRIGATRASLLATTDPLWAVLFAFLLLGESLHVGQAVGGAFILAGAVLAQREREPRGHAPTDRTPGDRAES